MSYSTGIVEDRKPTTAYKLNGITYLPHYEMPKRYVRPGYNERFNPTTFTSEQLLMFGAYPVKIRLWPRSWKE